MDRGSGGDLARKARSERGFEQLRRSGLVGGEKNLAAAREEGALQKIRGMADGGAFGDLPDLRAGEAVAIGDHHRPKYRSRPLARASILRSAMERLSIQKPQSGWIQETRPGPRTFSARSSVAAISSGVSTWLIF